MMISKHIGRSQSDLIRIFEDIKEELMNLYEERESMAVSENGDLEKVLFEKKELGRRLGEIEKKLEDREVFCSTVQRKQQEDAAEIGSLRKTVAQQRQTIADLEGALGDTQNQWDDSSKGEADSSQ